MVERVLRFGATDEVPVAASNALCAFAGFLCSTSGGAPAATASGRRAVGRYGSWQMRCRPLRRICCA